MISYGTLMGDRGRDCARYNVIMHVFRLDFNVEITILPATILSDLQKTQTNREWPTLKGGSK
jgi:hypothetical protein